MARSAFFLGFLVALARGNGLTLSVFNNSALVGPPATTAVLPNGNITFAKAGPYSAQLLGTFAAAAGESYAFQCSFGPAVEIAFVYVDDHLVCSHGTYGAGVDSPLPAMSKKELVVRAELFGAAAAAETAGGGDAVTVTANIEATIFAAGPGVLGMAGGVGGVGGYTLYAGYNIDNNDGRDMRTLGGDLTNVTSADCAAACEQKQAQGCVGFVRRQQDEEDARAVCFLRKLNGATDTCQAALSTAKTNFNTYTRDASCGTIHVPTPPPTPGLAPLPTARLTPSISAAEQTRLTLQRAHPSMLGWGAWLHRSILTLVKVPEGIALTPALCRLSTKQCDTATTIDKGPLDVRVGPHAYDRSYAQYYVHGGGKNVSVEFSGGSELQLLVTNIEGAANDDNDFAVVFYAEALWERAASIAVAPNGTALHLAPWGLDAVTLSASSATDVSVEASLPAAVAGAPHIALRLGGTPSNASAGISSIGATDASVDALRKTLGARRETELGRYAQFGELAEVKEAVQGATMWNLVYTPAEAGPLAPVARGWDFTSGARNKDWGYVIFDWDNIFASYMLGLDARELAYSNFIQVIRSKTMEGFVPNFAAATRKSEDRTEPPIGAKVLLEMYRRWGSADNWLVELLFDDLLDWSNWFLRDRLQPPLNLISLGGDGMQGARFESGLDNSPMYDGNFYNDSSHHMLLYDVGMSSMFVMEADALAELAAAIDRPEAQMLRQRAASMRTNIGQHLWDEESGAFVNKFSENGTFYRRISPTSFYSMLAGAATDAQARTMATAWLMNSSRFCIAPNGDFSGNDDTCYWGLPSISADDPAYPPLGYWRGYVWGPMSMLTYWSLQAYDHVPEVRQGRKAMAKQVTAMMLNQWRLHRHICENYNPHKDGTDCTGDKFYHWGGLTGLTTLIETGHYAHAQA